MSRPEHTLYLLLKHRCTHFSTWAHIHTHAHACAATHSTSPQTYTEAHTCSGSASRTLQEASGTANCSEFYEPSISSNPPFPALPLQYGLSTSLLSVWQWYQAKNVSSVDSRHEGTAAYTSASEPASWGIHSSGQVNTGALWNATHSFSLREAEPVQVLYKFTLYKVWWYSKPEGSIYKTVFYGMISCLKWTTKHDSCSICILKF